MSSIKQTLTNQLYLLPNKQDHARVPPCNYSILITGIDARSFTYEVKATTGFTINSNAALALTSNVDWLAIPYINI